MRGSKRLLALLQLSDSAFPTGSFSHSLALEAFHEAGDLADAEDLSLAVALHISSMATSDCVALRAAFDTEPDELARVDRLLSATKAARELREASRATGRRFLASVAALGVEDARLEGFAAAARSGETPGNLAAGWGVAAPALGVEAEEAALSCVYASAASLVAAGQKLVPLGGSAAQRVLFELGGEMERAVETSAEVEVEDMYAFAPEVDVYSMRHERQRTRLYIS